MFQYLHSIKCTFLNFDSIYRYLLRIAFYERYVYKNIKNTLFSLQLFSIVIQWLICLASPINGSGRYGMAIYEMAPIILSFTFGIKNDGKS